MGGGGLTACLEFGLARLIIEHEILHEAARLDVFEDALHFGLGFVGDDAWAGLDVAVFGSVRDRIAHVGDAAFIQQVDDQLGFVEAFEIGHLGCVASLDQRFETGLDEMGDAAAQHGLFAEEVGLAFFLEIGFDDARAAAANRAGIGQGKLLGETLAPRLLAFLMDGDEARDAAALDVLAAHGVTGTLGRDHDDVDIGGRIDQAEMNVEAVREGERAARLHLACDFVRIDRGLMLVRREDHENIGPFGGFGYGLHGEARAFGLLCRGRAFAQRNDNFADTAVAQVLRMGMTLAAISDDGDLLVLYQLLVAIGIVVDLHVRTFVK